MPDKTPDHPNKKRRPPDLRVHRQQTERNLVIGGFAAAFAIGGAVIWWQYGLGAAAATWACLGAGMALLGILYLILKLAEWWVNRRG